jgi:hypothetical protein
MSESQALRLDIGLQPDADPTEVEDATLQLRTELLELDVDTVERPRGAEPPPGTRGPEVALLGTLVLSAGQDVIRAVVQTIQGWIGRSESRSVKVTLGDDTIELTNASDEAQQRLVESFLARHAASSREH